MNALTISFPVTLRDGHRRFLANAYNLGDNILQFNFMRRACRENTDLRIDYFCKAEYHGQLRHLIDTEWSHQITLRPLEERPKGVLDTWIGSGFYFDHPRRDYYNEFYLEWFQFLAEAMGIECPIRERNDVLMRHPGIVLDNDPIDVFVINCQPKSGQFEFEPHYWDHAMAEWAKTLKVVAIGETSAPGVIKATVGLLSIADLACSAKEVVSICTGPLHMAFNTCSIRHVRRWHIFHRSNIYTYNDNILHYRDSKSILTIRPCAT